jgi:hypothetical protein
MIVFEKLFRASKGLPVVYNGLNVQMSDKLPVADQKTLHVTFESTKSDWRQGIYLKTDGSFECNGQIIKKAVVLWYDTAPREVFLKIKTKNEICYIKNVWDTGNGLMDSGHNGAAIIVEDHGIYRRYKCNDGRPDDDFDDLIFNVRIID